VHTFFALYSLQQSLCNAPGLGIGSVTAFTTTIGSLLHGFLLLRRSCLLKSLTHEWCLQQNWVNQMLFAWRCPLLLIYKPKNVPQYGMTAIVWVI
jgi:hypothetical protein